ncbi:MAG: uroporphyrinogen decarboxylase family protein [Deferribacteres bacterium]|nr:uroporphyrinogen decarboxylase family protein [candidate division KSB1 bacterium]MCB9501662.1 uroporphyrinogen decarboxylase family protein [Deferribacteres bacterium]
MNSFERMQNRLQGKVVDRPPNFDIFMVFAAHFIKQPLAKYYLDYRVLVEANRAMVENFHVDIMQAISDPYRETHDFGAAIEFPEDDLPVCKIPLLEKPEDLNRLAAPKPENGRRMSDRLAAIRLMKEKVGSEIPVMGWVEGALAEAGDLRGVGTVMMDIYERPEWLKELLEIVVELEIAFAETQIAAGADIVGLGDALCSQISPAMYREFALPYEQRIIAAIHDKGALARLHICGDTNQIVDDMVKTGADMIDLDWMVDMRAACERYGDRLTFCGNFDPVKVMLRGNPEEVYAATEQSIYLPGNRTFSAAGCEIPDRTPHENLFAQTRALRNYQNK